MLGPPPPTAQPTSDAEINALAARFDAEASDYKSRNTGFISKAHPEFQNYIKAFIIKAKDSSISIYLNSTHRNRAQQDKLIAEHARGERRIKPAQYSYHLVGLAFDFNPVLANGQWVKSKDSKQTWINTGIVTIGESVGLRWAVIFLQITIPCILIWEQKVSKDKMKQMVSEANKKGLEGTQIPIGNLPPTPPVPQGPPAPYTCFSC